MLKQLIVNHLPDVQMETFKATTFYLWIINQGPTGILPLLTPSLIYSDISWYGMDGMKVHVKDL